MSCPPRRQGGPGLFTALFIYSKLPELLDTVFLVVQKKPVIFLHWFHHCTVLLYCWHAFHHSIGPGIWFAAMNYSVHSVMYLYYFVSIIGYGAFAKRLAPIITSMQLLQMIAGCVVTYISAAEHTRDPAACFVDPANYKLGFGMYFSYLILFAMLFYNLYLAPRPPKPAGGGKDGARTKIEVCGVDVGGVDSAGKFMPRAGAPEAKKTA